MAEKTGEDLLNELVKETWDQEHPNQAIPWELIITIAFEIFKNLQGCNRPGAIIAAVKRQSVIANGVAWSTMRSAGYRGDALKFGRQLVANAAKKSETELQMIIDKAQEVPPTVVNTPSVQGGGWVFGLLVVIGLMFGSSVAQADWPMPDYTDFDVSIDPTPKPPAVVAQPKSDPLRFPYHQQWTWPGGTQESLYHHLLTAPQHRLPEELIKGRSFKELVAIHNSSHDGMLTYEDPPRGSNSPRVTPASFKAPPTASNASKGVRGVEPRQVVRTPQASRRGLFGRQLLPSVRSYCPGGNCP